MKIKTIGIAGSGTMGASMAETFAKYGYKVKLYDISKESLENAKKLIAINQKTELSEKIITKDESDELQSRISYDDDINALKDIDFLIEAIKEDLNIKQIFWKEISQLVNEKIVLASNTSGLSITEIAKVIKNPERFAGMHWINPPHIIPLVEIIKGEKTSSESADIIFDLSLKVGKKPVIVKDAPGFVLNRIQFAILRECLHMAKEGIASMEDIDNVMKYGLGIRYACLGPFEVADLGGLDVFHNIASYLFEDLSCEKHSFYLLKEAFEKGDFGVKTGKGFYDYSNGKDEEKIKYRDEMFTKLSKVLYDK